MLSKSHVENTMVILIHVFVTVKNRMQPVAAVPRVLYRTGTTLSDIDIIELNEAFLAQSLAVIRELGVDEEKTNVNGVASRPEIQHSTLQWLLVLGLLIIYNVLKEAC